MKIHNALLFCITSTCMKDTTCKEVFLSIEKICLKDLCLCTSEYSKNDDCVLQWLHSMSHFKNKKVEASVLTT